MCASWVHRYNTSAKPQLKIFFVHLLMGSQFNKFYSFISYIWISRHRWRHTSVAWAPSSSSCTGPPANLCFLFYAISKGCNGPILDNFFSLDLCFPKLSNDVFKTSLLQKLRELRRKEYENSKMCTCTSLPANLCFLFYAISKGCNGPILDFFFFRRFVFP